MGLKGYNNPLTLGEYGDFFGRLESQNFLALHMSRVVRKWAFRHMQKNSKASGKPAHPCSLARSFAACLKFYQGLLLVKANSFSKASDVIVLMRKLA